MLEFDSELYFRVAFFAFLIPLGSGVCIDLDLGLENERISDGNITASSAKNASTPAKNGRLNYTLGSSWCAGTSDTNPYLQIDLQTLHIICAVSTQGNSQADQWVKTYKLQFSIDGTTWTDYKEVGQVKFFMGNDDRNSAVKHVVYRLLTRYLRFLPQTHQGGVCMRAEVFGVKQKPENLALGKATTQSSTFNNTGDNVYGVSGNAVDGNSDTNFLKGSCSYTQKDNPSWWRVDLGSNLVDVSEVHIVNRFSQHVVTKYYKITFGSFPNVASNTLCEGLYDFHNFTASAVCFTKPLKTGRYVGILTTQEENLQLCEVEVYSRENLAFQKPTYHHSRSVDNGTSDKAVDGNSNMIFADGSCTFGAGDEFPWWRVDLGQDEFVTEVYIVNIQGKTRLGKFEIRVGTVSSITDTSITSPKCGQVATYDVPSGESLSFFCRPSLKGRYVTIRDLRNGPSVFNLCEVEVYSEQRACHSQAIGVTSSDSIPDNSISASVRANSNREPWFGRLNKISRGWAPGRLNDPDYLQIDLLYDYVICAIATQGANDINQWTTKYIILLSLNDTTFDIYKENNTEKVFNGNSGGKEIVKHGLKEYALARFIRFVPTEYHDHKTLRVEVYGVLLSTVPSQAPGNFTVTAKSSTSLRASWASLPEYARHGTITGYKVFYRQKGSANNSVVDSVIGAGILSKDFSNLNKYTKYEFQVLAMGSRGEGPKSPVMVGQTLEDAPSIPSILSRSEIKPDKQVGPKLKLTWHKPAEENGIIKSYTVFYSHDEDPHNINTETLGGNMLSYTVDVLGGATYQFHVRAATIKPGPNATLSVTINDYEPSVAPNDVSFSRLNQTTFNISWSPLTRKESYGKVISYEVKMSLVSSGSRQKRSPANSKTVNTTKAFVILYDIQPCYNVYVRAYTKAGPGPYGQPLPLELNKVPGAPNNLRATDSQSTEMTLEWVRPQPAMEEKWKVEYSGKKSYNNSFSHEGSKDVQGTTKYTLDNLVPGTKYDLRVYGISKCGNNGFPSSLEVETKIGEPLAPVVLSLTTRKVAELRAEIDLWPAEQRNGPISAYQIIILKVSDCVQELPRDFDLKLKDLNDKNLNFYPFYIAAEIENDPVREKSWKFTVGDGKSYGTFINKELTKGENYFAYERAISRFNGQILEGYASKVALISVTPESLKYTKETIKGDASECQVLRAAVVALCCIVFVLLIVIGALIWRLRRTEPNKKATTVNSGIPAPSGGRQVSEPSVYMELHPRPSEGKSREPSEYQSLQDTQVTSNYYNVGFKRERSGKKDGGM